MIVLNEAAVQSEILKSQAMLEVCEEIAEQIAPRYGAETHEIVTRTGSSRVCAEIQLKGARHD